MDRHGRMVHCSEVFARMLGYSRKEAEALAISDWDETIAKEDGAPTLESLIDQPRTFETRHRRKDGSFYTAEVTAIPATRRGVAYLYASARDLTEQEREASELRELKERYRQFFEVNTSVKLVIDPVTGAIVQANRAACDFYGYPRERLEAMNIEEINILTPEEISAERDAALREERLYFEFRHRLASGEIRDVEVYSGPVQMGDRALLYSIIHDVTEENKYLEQLEQERARLGLVLEGTNAGIWEWNIQTGETRFNDRWAEIIGFALEELEPTTIDTWAERAHPDDLAESDARLKAHFRGDSDTYDCICRMRHKKGHWVWVHDSGQVMSRTDDGEPEWMYGTHIDVTTSKEAEISAERSLSNMEAIARSVNAGILSLDRAMQVDYLSPRFTELFGYAQEDLVDWEAWLEKAAFDESTRATLRRAPAGYGPGLDWQEEQFDNLEIKLRTAQGSVIDTLISMHRTEVGPVMTFADISQQKQREEYIEFVAQHDTLTGLPNRTLLSERIDWYMKQARRGRWFLCVAFLDLDGFKNINDTYGHDAGDHVLKVVAQRLRKELREVDTIARLGGDEFAIAFTELGSHEECAPLVRRILETASAPIPFKDHRLEVSCSIGLTFYSQAPEVDGDQLLRQADQAMYEAKVAGKNRFSVFDPKADQSLRRQHKELDDIQAGLANNEFQLYYQPKVNLRTGAVIGAEALIRWRRAPADILAPDAFLPVVYDHALSEDLGAWVLKQAMRDINALREVGRALPISVNVFPRQIVSPLFPETLRQLLADHPATVPRLLQLEVVETAVINEIDTVRSVLRDCAALGIRCSLDDFGTGFSSLSHLKHLPVQELKIDRVFVTDILAEPDSLAIVKGTLSLARAFSLSTIAEGVETLEQGIALLDLGCDAAQGYAIARPMALEDLLTWIEAWRPPQVWLDHATRLTGP